MLGPWFVVAAAVIWTASAFGQQTDPDASSREDKADQAAFQAVCGKCHPTSVASGIRSEADWEQTVEEMIKEGAKGTDEQFDRLMRFLLRTFTKVNVNTAPASEIAPVLDISDATAEALVKRRTEKGSFKTLEELKKFPGVDASKLEARKDRVMF